MELINEQLTLAEETFTEFNVIVKAEEEMDDQSRELDSPQTRSITSDRTDHLLDHVWKEEVFSDEQRCKQERDSSLDQFGPFQIKEELKEEQQEPEHSWIKEEILEVRIGEQEEQLVLKQETEDAFMVTPNLVGNIYIKPEPIRNQVISQDCNETDNQDQEGNHHKDSGSVRDKGPKPNKRSQENSKCNISEPKRMKETRRVNHLISCKLCSEKPFLGMKCRRRFRKKRNLRSHMMTHTGESPFSCSTCKRVFRSKQSLNGHMRIHPVVLAFSCNTCERVFGSKLLLNSHKTTHEVALPVLCDICKRSFGSKHSLEVHKRVHKPEQSFSCIICGESFLCIFMLSSHMKTHK